MNRKHALVLALIAAGVVGYVGARHIVGGNIETGFREGVTKAAKGGLSGNVVEYRRGMFSSKVRTQWTFNDIPGAPKLFIDHDITHGPTLSGDMARIESRLDTPEEIKAQLEPLFKGQPLLKVESLVAFSGQSRHHVSSPTAEGKLEEVNVSWGGLSGDIDIGAAGATARGQLQAPSLKLKGNTDNQEITLENLTLGTDQARAPGFQFYTGAAEFKIARLQVNSPDGGADLRGLSVKSDAALDQGLVSLGVDMGVEQVAAAGEKVSNAAFTLRFNRLDAATFDSLTKAMETIQSKGGNAEEQQAMLGGAALEHLPKLLAQKPEIELRRLGATTVEGATDINLRLRYVGQGQLLAFNPMRDLEGELRLGTPAALVTRLALDSGRSAAREQAEALEMELTDDKLEQLARKHVAEIEEAIAGTGLLVRDGGNWRGELTLKGGQLSANGKPIDPAELMALGGGLME